MKLCLLVLTTVLCLHVERGVTARAKSRGCRTGRPCKVRLNSRLRLLRDLSKSMYRGGDVLGLTLQSLNDYNREGTFGVFDAEASQGYDIPKYVCPRTDDNTELLPCPSTDMWNRVHCIGYYALCDHKVNCPKGEDEDPTMCLFHQASHKYMKEILDTMYRLFKGGRK